MRVRKRKEKKKVTIPEKIGKKKLTIQDPIFRRRVHVLINHTVPDYVRFLNRMKVKDVAKDNMSDFAAWAAPIGFDDRPTEYVIFMPEFQWAIYHQGTLIHEITHVVIRIFDNNNIPFNHDTQEFIAHAIARMYEDVAHKLLVPIK